MTSASSSSALHLFHDSKKRLCTRVGVIQRDLGSVARQIIRSSKSNEILGHSIKNFTQVDVVSDYSFQNLQKIGLILDNVNYQEQVIRETVNHLEFLKEQVTAMER